MTYVYCSLKRSANNSVARWRFGATKLASALRCALTLAVFSALLLAALQPARAQTETVLYSFGSQSGDGYIPVAGLVMDKKGNLYGTTFRGGAYYVGTVYEVTPAGTETVLYSFGSQSGDGVSPCAGVVMDKKGNLYGTTSAGGAYDGGTVYKVTPAGTETVLYSFGSQSGDGAGPTGLVMKGKLYGTTYLGGAYGDGTVFKVTLAGKETVLYSFGSPSGDGCYPSAGLVMDKSGNLYGTAYEGGTYGNGTVYKVTPAGKEIVLYSFGSQSGDGAGPYAGLVMDSQGNLYGTTSAGGAYDGGTVYKVTPAGTETVLYSFGSQSGDGGFPCAGVVMDKKGNLYGTTYAGGAYYAGTVYKVTPVGKETVLHSFGSQSGDGAGPYGSLVMDKKGNLYGTTSAGGAQREGTVYEVTP